MPELKLTVLIENTAPEGLIREHGLSVHLDYRGRSLLLDAGESGAFLANAHKLGVDLSAVELAFLSHGHFDHGDGLTAFFAVNRSAPVYARTQVSAPDYHGEEYIGVNPGLFQRHGKRFLRSDRPAQPAPGVWTIPDGVRHEQSLVLETSAGLVILNSCCHDGADRVVESVRARFPGVPVRALIGGFHLMGKDGVKSLGPSPREVRLLADRLFNELGVAEVWTGHCTGVPAMALLRETFPRQVHPLITGLVLEF